MSTDTSDTLSTIDGRHKAQAGPAMKYFAPRGLNQYRVLVEMYHVYTISEEICPESPCPQKMNLIRLSAEQHRRIEQLGSVGQQETTAVQRFIEEYMKSNGLAQWVSYVHYGISTQDVDNIAVQWALKEFLKFELIPKVFNMIYRLEDYANQWIEIPMVARVHGLAAGSTYLGKEIMVYVERLRRVLAFLDLTPLSVKYGGAIGQHGELAASHPDKDWNTYADQFCVDYFSMERERFTTQRPHYDGMAAVFNGCKQLCVVMLDFIRDMCAYIGLKYFVRHPESSPMPHKVNPIKFEDGEGNFEFAVSMFEFMARKLPNSRLQRDASDSTVLGNLGLPFGHMLVGLCLVTEGITDLSVNNDCVHQDLMSNWIPVAQAIQTLLSREKYSDASTMIKDLIQDKDTVSREDLHAIITKMPIQADLRTELLAITPLNYTGQVQMSKWKDIIGLLKNPDLSVEHTHNQ